MKKLMLILLFVLSCNNIDTPTYNKEKILFKVNSDQLSLSDMRNKLSLPCGENTLFPTNESQIPNAQSYFFNEYGKEVGINFQCNDESIIFPIGSGIVIDIHSDSLQQEAKSKQFLTYASKLSELTGYMPNNVRKLFYGNYIIVDHAFYFSEKYRTYSVYSNLKGIPETLYIGQEVDINTELGFINTEFMDVLSTTFIRNDEEGILEVEKNILNFELYFESDYKTYHLGQGLGSEAGIDYYNIFFIKE
jgi:hypothetical protein